MEWTDKAIALKVTLLRGMNLRGQILNITLVVYPNHVFSVFHTNESVSLMY